MHMEVPRCLLRLTQRFASSLLFLSRVKCTKSAWTVRCILFFSYVLYMIKQTLLYLDELDGKSNAFNLVSLSLPDKDLGPDTDWEEWRDEFLSHSPRTLLPASTEGSGSSIGDFVLDETRNVMYYVVVTETSSKIVKADWNAAVPSQTTQVLQSILPPAVSAIAFDNVAQTLFFAQEEDSTVWSVGLDGSNPVRWGETYPILHPVGLAVDSTGEFLYMICRDAGHSGPGDTPVIHRAPISGAPGGFNTVSYFPRNGALPVQFAEFLWAGASEHFTEPTIVWSTRDPGGAGVTDIDSGETDFVYGPPPESLFGRPSQSIAVDPEYPVGFLMEAQSNDFFENPQHVVFALDGSWNETINNHPSVILPQKMKIFRSADVPGGERQVPWEVIAVVAGGCAFVLATAFLYRSKMSVRTGSVTPSSSTTEAFTKRKAPAGDRGSKGSRGSRGSRGSKRGTKRGSQRRKEPVAGAHLNTAAAHGFESIISDGLGGDGTLNPRTKADGLESTGTQAARLKLLQDGGF